MNIIRVQLNHYLLIPIALAIFVANVVLLDVVEDDAYISFRYLDNWLAGYGLVFNTGERVEGYTNLLWILLMAPWRALGLPLEIVSLTLSIISAGVLFAGVYFMAARLTRHADAGIAAVMLVASFPPLAHYVTSGLETILFAALITLAFARISVIGKPDLWVATFLGTAVMTRPEGMMVGAIVYGVYGLLRKSIISDRHVMASTSLFLFFPIALTCWRLWYYGDPLPNTFYAKATGMGLEFISRGVQYLSLFVVGQYGWLLLAFAMYAFWPPVLRKFNNKALAFTMGLVLLMHFLYIVKIGGDYLPMSRFILHVFPLLAVLSVLGMWYACRERAGIVLALATIIAITQNMAFYKSADYEMVGNIRGSDANLKSVANWLASNYPANTLIAVDNAGIIPYMTGFKTIDMLGLNDKHIARAKPSIYVTSNAGFIPGHFKYDGEYVCSLQPDVVITLRGLAIVASSPREAAIVAAMNSLDSSRAFLQACGDRYQPNISKLENGRYQVLYTKRRDISDISSTSVSVDAEYAAFDRGLDLLSRARLPEARESFMESIRNNQHLQDSYTNIGYTYFDEGRLKDAVIAFEDTLRRYPGYPPAIYGLALSTDNLGDSERAIQLWRQYLHTDADPKWKARAAKRLLMLGYKPVKEPEN